ncbi:MAG: M23 family metallopeptidase [Pyrinomonadaceae bacterium]
MQKNDKTYTFLLSHSSKSKIYIKRIAINKSYLHFGSVGIFLILGITTFAVGISGIVRNTAFAESLSKTSALSQVANEPAKITEPIAEAKLPTATDYAFNSGGPEEGNEVDGETSEIDTEIASIRKNADPAYLPSMWAHLGKINNEFGFRRNPFGGRAYEFHPGMDIDGERGDLVTAPANGIVIKSGWTGGYGNMIEIDHGNGLSTRYGHLSKIEIGVGDTITRGQLIGYIGSTGRSTGPHLHFELRLNDKSINPRHFLVPEPTDLTTIAK